MYSGKMFFSTQSDSGAARFSGHFSHSINAIIDGGAVSAAAAALSDSNAALSSPSPGTSVDHVFVRWHNWRGMKNWSICGHWSDEDARIHDIRGTMIPQLAFLNKYVRYLIISARMLCSLCTERVPSEWS
jgi:hypothetical protein